MLSYRLEQVNDKIVSPDQTSYIKGRRIGTNICLIEDLIEHAGIQNRKGVLLFSDFKKAFDLLELYFMFKTIETQFWPVLHNMGEDIVYRPNM